MKRLFLSVLLVLTFTVFAGDTVRPGLERIEQSMPDADEQAFLDAFKQPFFDGLDVSAALQCWFDGRLLSQQKQNRLAKVKWMEASHKLKDVKPLPKTEWGPWPDATFTVVKALNLPSHPMVNIDLVEWSVDNLKEYGVLLYPKNPVKDAKYPLFLYCHGAAFGLPGDFMNFLADLVELGYVIIGPAMRGEDVFQFPFPINGKELKCEGEIENLDGEVNDCLSMLSAAWKLPYVRPNEFAMIGHSFGAGVGLLAAARGGAKAKAVVSYDAWLVNPQRYYWDRMRRAPRNWDSWEDFCNQPPLPQLTGLLKRSIIHNADMLQCPLLLFIGGAYEGSVFHESHSDFTAVLDKLKKPYKYETIPNGGHNFVLYRDSLPAKLAWKSQMAFLEANYPPLKTGK
ncbi:MAG: prolyl oligopeptidase family serine peptidase [Victivallales bacterium]|nr:prolyl oligopeptidase family serine peptidase [Victivallales bacterium]